MLLNPLLLIVCQEAATAIKWLHAVNRQVSVPKQRETGGSEAQYGFFDDLFTFGKDFIE